MDDLTPKQAAFVREYLIDMNGYQAAIRAGYKPTNAAMQASRLLSDAKVCKHVEEALQSRSERTKIDADWLLKRMAEEAEADLSDLYDDNGAIKPMKEWPKIWRQGLVAGIEHVEVRDAEGNATGDVIVKVKLSDRVRRLELIGKHVKVNAFQEIVQHKGLDGLANRLARAKKRGG